MMIGVQGIIVSGEASESDEEEEFCAAVARGQLVSQRLGRELQEDGSKVTMEKKLLQTHQHRNRIHTSLLHQKLWEANTSLERNLSQCIRGPIREQARRISRMNGSLPAAQTSTLSAHSALVQSTRNLSHLNFLLTGLKDNPLVTLKAT